MGRRVDIDDLIDAHEVAQMLGLSQPNNVHLYQRRYADMPRPVLDRGGRRPKLWLGSEIRLWMESRAAAGSSHPTSRDPGR